MTIQRVVIGLAVIYVLTFLGGFLQATPFNFVNHLLFALLFMGGVVLIVVTVKSQATGMTKGTLLSMGVTSAVLFLLFLAYEWFRTGGRSDLEGSFEGLLYLATLVFWILVVVSLVLVRRIASSTEPVA